MEVTALGQCWSQTFPYYLILTSPTQPGLELLSLLGMTWVATVELYIPSWAKNSEGGRGKEVGLRAGQVHPADVILKVTSLCHFLLPNFWVFPFGVWKPEKNLDQPGDKQSPNLAGISETSEFCQFTPKKVNHDSSSEHAIKYIYLINKGTVKHLRNSISEYSLKKNVRIVD